MNASFSIMPPPRLLCGLARLMPFDNAHAFNFDLAGGGSDFEHAATLAFVAAGNDHHLIVLLDF